MLPENYNSAIYDVSRCSPPGVTGRDDGRPLPGETCTLGCKAGYKPLKPFSALCPGNGSPWANSIAGQNYANGEKFTCVTIDPGTWTYNLPFALHKVSTSVLFF